MSTYACSCGHLRVQHRHGSGRCMMARCGCLQGPPKPPLPAVLQSVQRVRARTTDGDGLVIEVQQSERKKLENMLWRRIEEAGLPEPTKEYRWALPERQFRSDFAYPNDRILLEVQGGIWAANPGRHNRGSGYQEDLSRANLAAILGWKLLAFSEGMIKSGEAVETIRRALTPAEQLDEQLALERTAS